MLAGKSDLTEKETYDRARQLKDYKVSVYTCTYSVQCAVQEYVTY